MNGRRKIVVGLDDSAEARSALAWARLVAAPDDQLVVVHAWSNPVANVPAYTTIAVFPDEDAHQIAKEDLDRLLEGVDDRRIQPYLVHGRPGPGIVAQAEDADLIVVGHRGEGRVSMMLGSTANHVAHHATCPVVIVRDGTPIAPRRVVVGVDDHHLDHGTNESVAALRWAVGLDGVDEVRVVHAWTNNPVPWDLTGATSVHVGDHEVNARRVIDRVVAAAGPIPDGVAIVPVTIRDLPGPALLGAGDDADLIVVGTRGRSGVRELLLGSTSVEVAAHSRVPVAIVR